MICNFELDEIVQCRFYGFGEVQRLKEFTLIVAFYSGDVVEYTDDGVIFGTTAKTLEKTCRHS